MGAENEVSPNPSPSSKSKVFPSLRGLLSTPQSSLQTSGPKLSHQVCRSGNLSGCEKAVRCCPYSKKLAEIVRANTVKHLPRQIHTPCAFLPLRLHGEDFQPGRNYQHSCKTKRWSTHGSSPQLFVGCQGTFQISDIALTCNEAAETTLRRKGSAVKRQMIFIVRRFVYRFMTWRLTSIKDHFTSSNRLQIRQDCLPKTW